MFFSFFVTLFPDHIENHSCRYFGKLQRNTAFVFNKQKELRLTFWYAFFNIIHNIYIHTDVHVTLSLEMFIGFFLLSPNMLFEVCFTYLKTLKNTIFSSLKMIIVFSVSII